MHRAWVWLVGILALIGAAQLGKSVTESSAKALKARASRRRQILQTAAGSSLSPESRAVISHAASARAQANGSLESSTQDIGERLASNGNASTSFPAEPQLSDPLQGQ